MKPKLSSTLPLFPIFVCIAPLLLLASAHAQTGYTWNGTTDTDFATTTNWDGGPPGIVAPSGGGDSSPTSPYTNSRISVYNGSNNPLYYTGTQGYTTYAASGGTTYGRSLVIASGGTGSANNGSMFITGGTFDSRSDLGDVVGNSGRTGSLTIDGGAYTNVNGGIKVFYLGLGSEFNLTTNSTLTLTSGSFTAGALQIGQDGFFFGSISSTVNLDGGLLEVGQIRETANGGDVTSTINFNGGTLKARQNTSAFISGIGNALIDGGAIIDTNGFDVAITTGLTDGIGAGDLTKSGLGILTLTGANTYTGNTIIEDGTLSVSQSNFADTSTVTIGTAAASPAVLNLPNAGTDIVAALIIDGVSQPGDGAIYDSTDSGGAITGDGKIQVGTAPVSGYASWASDNSVVEGENGDDDKDGVINLVEYALGLDPQVGDPAPGTFANKTLTFTKGPEAKVALDVTYKIETSTTLALGSWTVATATEDADSISYTLPANEPGGKIFGRIKVTKP